MDFGIGKEILSICVIFFWWGGIFDMFSYDVKGVFCCLVLIVVVYGWNKKKENIMNFVVGWYLIVVIEWN